MAETVQNIEAGPSFDSAPSQDPVPSLGSFPKVETIATTLESIVSVQGSESEEKKNIWMIVVFLKQCAERIFNRITNPFYMTFAG